MKTKEELQAMFNQTTLQLGSLVYQNDALDRQREKNEAEIEKLQRKLRDIALEASKIVDMPAPAPEASDVQS